jgi:metallo-beta-lactamase class B VIM
MIGYLMNLKHTAGTLLVFCLLAGLLSQSCFAGATGKGQKGKQVISDNLTIEKIRPGVWIHTSHRALKNGVMFPGNGMLVRSGDDLLMIETAWGADITIELLDWIDREIGLEVRAAVITHFHEDSLGGSSILADRGIPFYASGLTGELAADEAGPSPVVLPGLRRPGSVVLFNGLEIYFPGAAHSHDNVVVWIPNEKILFGGCAVRSPVFPGKGNTADADVAEWPHSIKRLDEHYRDAEIVVPGHGPAATPDILEHTIKLFTTDQ